MVKNQKLSAALAVRKLTLSEVVFDKLMTPSVTANAVMKAALVVFGSVLLAASAQFKIPLYPVPITGQTLVVLLIGMTYGSRLGGITIAAYLLEGALGLPVFAGGAAGVAVLMGPTGGYLFGFFLAGMAMGYLAELGMGRTAASTVAAMVIGNCLIYLCGALWLANFIGFSQAIAAGVLPFLYGDALKLVVAAALMPMAWRVLKSVR